MRAVYQVEPWHGPWRQALAACQAVNEGDFGWVRWRITAGSRQAQLRRLVEAALREQRP